VSDTKLSHHSELEAKLVADGLKVGDFKRFMLMNYDIQQYKQIKGPDTYYEQGVHVVRYRFDSRHHKNEVTVKRRKSVTSTRDRLEIDLPLATGTQPIDIDGFLCASGFKRAFTIVKEGHVYWTRLSKSLEASIVYYTCWEVDISKREAGTIAIAETLPPVHGSIHTFIEIEAEKGSAVSQKTAERRIQEQVKIFREEFGLDKPVNKSLYEIYSGKPYAMKEKENVEEQVAGDGLTSVRGLRH
jgi:hypothetical protein